jgi:DNA-binding YbaB/EbfC family protein
MKNIGKMLQQAQEVQEKMGRVQEELAVTEITGMAGAGLVSLTLNGKGELLKISIDPSILTADDKDLIEDLIIAAHRDTKAKVEAHVAQEMGKVTGGLQLPPGMKLPF